MYPATFKSLYCRNNHPGEVVAGFVDFHFLAEDSSSLGINFIYFVMTTVVNNHYHFSRIKPSGEMK